MGTYNVHNTEHGFGTFLGYALAVAVLVGAAMAGLTSDQVSQDAGNATEGVVRPAPNAGGASYFPAQYGEIQGTAEAPLATF